MTLDYRSQLAAALKAVATCAVLLGVSSPAIAQLTNIAPLGEASQSTTAFGGVAGFANDGNTGGSFFGDGATHTAGGDAEPFWEVSFAADFDIENMILWNRTDCCGDRLSNLSLSIFDDDVEIYESVSATGSFINTDNELGSPQFIEIDLLGTVGAQTGDRVRITRFGEPLTLAEVQIFAETNLEPRPVLEIVRQTGRASLRNNTLTTFEIAGYSIQSTEGNLTPDSWLSISENYDADNGGLLDDTNNWVEFTADSSTNDISEGTLGTTVIAAGIDPIDLGTIWTPNATEDDLTANFLLATGTDLEGIDVVFRDAIAIPGDYNQDEIVDAADYTVWRDNEGSPDSLPNDDTPGVGPDDYTRWVDNFGATSAPAAAVPEPSSAWLLASVGAALGLGRRRNGRRSQQQPAPAVVARSGRVVASLAAVVAMTAAASADFTVDRFYQFGDDPGESATVGGAVDGVTFDSEGTGEGLQDLDSVGTITYVDVAGRPMGGTGLGVEFDGSSYLVGDALGFPSGAQPNPTRDYDGIFTRGFMGWVKPDANGLGNGVRQSVVTDSEQFHFFIDEDDNFGLRHGVINLATREREVTSNVQAEADTWYHFHLHSFGTAPGVLYIDGLAVAFVNSFYGGAGPSDLIVGAGFFFDQNFSGELDDLTLYVAGTNSSDEDFGTFNILEDNPFIAEALEGFVQGDLNGDGVVMGDGSGALGEADDVKTFIDNWLFEKLIPSSNLDNDAVNEEGEKFLLSTGDLETRLKGDFSLDGDVDLLDWGILRSVHPDGDNLDLGALLAARGIPEPTSALMALLAATGCLAARKR